MKKTIFVDLIDNEDGFLLVMSLMILTILTIIGISTTDTTRFELTVAANERVHDLAFYAAESARSYVEASPSFYGSGNTDEGEGRHFPDGSDYVNSSFPDPDPNPTKSANSQPLGPDQSYHGRVVYQGASTSAMRGSGYSVGTFQAHVYNMSCIGTEPRGSETQVDAGFFRIGF